MDLLAANLPWYIARSAAIAAYILMFFIIVIGTGMTTGFIYRVSDPLKIWVVHQYLAISLTVFIIVHAIALMFDKYVNFKLADILIPFSSSYKTLYLSSGIIGFYVLIILIITSVYWRLKYAKVWLGMHYLSYFLFAISFIHGVFIGTDSSNWVMQTVYWTTGLIYLWLMIYRFHWYKKNHI